MPTSPAVSTPRKLTMLFSVAATGAALAATLRTDDEPTDSSLPAVAEAPRVETAPAPVPPPPRVELLVVDRPLVLRSGAPACGNLMSKAAIARPCSPGDLEARMKRLGLLRLEADQVRQPKTAARPPAAVRK